jgi:putative transcription factor
MSQKEFASRIKEKESTLRGLESGSLRPTLAQAKRLERLLGIRVLQEVEAAVIPRKEHAETLTLGDVVRIRK